MSGNNNSFGLSYLSGVGEVDVEEIELVLISRETDIGENGDVKGLSAAGPRRSIITKQESGYLKELHNRDELAARNERFSKAEKLREIRKEESIKK